MNCSKLNQFIFPNRQYKKDEDEVQREVKNKEDFLNLDATPNYKALLTVWNFQEQFSADLSMVTLQEPHRNINMFDFCPLFLSCLLNLEPLWAEFPVPVQIFSKML